MTDYAMARDPIRDRGRDDRFEDRGRGGGAGGGGGAPYINTDTNSNDETLINSRVFIGNLPTDRLKRTDISEIFEKYGNIKAVSLLRGYGFVQFMEEADAREAVKNENGRMMAGHKLDIKMAAEGRKKKDGGGRGRGDGMRGGFGGMRGGRDRGPPRDMGRGGGGRDRSPLRESYGEGRERREGRREPPFGRGPYDDPYGSSRLDADPIRLRENDNLTPGGLQNRDPFSDRDPFSRPGARDLARDLEPKRPSIDCEIICTNRTQRPYADEIEGRLKENSLVVFVNTVVDADDLPKAVAEVNRQGTLYCITLNDTNVRHRSLTLNILHGTPQEHRNMPLEHAFDLIARNYLEYLKKLREGPTNGAGGKKADFQAPDENTTYLLNLVLDNRFLTLDELDTCIKYFNERRAGLAMSTGAPPKAELPPAILPPVTPAKTSQSEIAQQQQELQAKILNILGQDANTGTPGVPQVPVAQPQIPGYPSIQPPASSSGMSINFNNPSVQKALDNLISSKPLLNTLGTPSAAPPQPAPTTPAQQGAYSMAGQDAYGSQYATQTTPQPGAYQSPAPPQPGSYGGYGASQTSPTAPGSYQGYGQGY